MLAVITYHSRLSGKIRVWRSLVSRLNGVQEASSSNLDTRTKKAETVFTVSAFFFCVERFEPRNATLRWSVARCGLDRIDSLISRISTLGSFLYKSLHASLELYFPASKFVSIRHHTTAKLYAGRLHPPYATLPKRRPGSPPGRRFLSIYGYQQHPVLRALAFHTICPLDFCNCRTAALGNIPEALTVRAAENQ